MIQPSTRGGKQENFVERQHARPAVLDREVPRRELVLMPGKPLAERGERHGRGWRETVGISVSRPPCTRQLHVHTFLIH